MSPSGVGSVSNPGVEVKNLAVDGICLHEAWPQNGRQRHNIHVKTFVLDACELVLCILKGLQPDIFGMSRPLNRLEPSHQGYLWLNRASGLE